MSNQNSKTPTSTPPRKASDSEDSSLPESLVSTPQSERTNTTFTFGDVIQEMKANEAMQEFEEMKANEAMQKFDAKYSPKSSRSSGSSSKKSSEDNTDDDKLLDALVAEQAARRIERGSGSFSTEMTPQEGSDASFSDKKNKKAAASSKKANTKQDGGASEELVKYKKEESIVVKKSNKKPTVVFVKDQEKEVSVIKADETAGVFKKDPNTDAAALDVTDLDDYDLENGDGAHHPEKLASATVEKPVAASTGMPRRYKIYIIVAVFLWLLLGIIAFVAVWVRRENSSSSSSNSRSASNEKSISAIDGAFNGENTDGVEQVIDTAVPTVSPTAPPTLSPTASPTAAPTTSPTDSPTEFPTSPEPEQIVNPNTSDPDDCNCLISMEVGICKQDGFLGFLDNLLFFNWFC